MIKRVLNSAAPPSVAVRPDPIWLTTDDILEVAVTSESDTHPLEAALAPEESHGWRAASPGPQTVRVRFPQPRPLRFVRVVVEESERERTQQLVLRAAPAADGPWRELVRQQFNFSPAGATREEENFRVDLPSIAALELTIVPDIGGGDARASLQQLRIA